MFHDPLLRWALVIGSWRPTRTRWGWPWERAWGTRCAPRSPWWGGACWPPRSRSARWRPSAASSSSASPSPPTFTRPCDRPSPRGLLFILLILLSSPSSSSSTPQVNKSTGGEGGGSAFRRAGIIFFFPCSISICFQSTILILILIFILILILT